MKFKGKASKEINADDALALNRHIKELEKTVMLTRPIEEEAADAGRPEIPVTIQTEAQTPMPLIQTAGSSHIGTREYQQDSYQAGVSKDGIVFGVLCDGMGGLDDGGAASQAAVQYCCETLSQMEPGCDIPAFLTGMAHKANEIVYSLPSAAEQRGTSGTTLTAAVISGSSLYWVSVGDSRIYIIRGNEIAAVTRDHSYSLELDEKAARGQISAEEAENDPQRGALISYLGMDALNLIDVNRSPFMLEPGDMILLCSDGLYRSLSEADILETVGRHAGTEDSGIEECARVLPLYAFDKSSGSQDNTTVILFRYQ